MPTIPWNGATVAYSDEGSGPAVVLAHASTGSRAQWGQLIRRLAGRYRTLALDLYGYGKTSSWPVDRRLTLDEEAAIVRAVAGLAEGPCHLVGHSYGGVAALQAAVHLGERVKSLVLIEPTAAHLLRLEGEQDAWAEISGAARRYMALLEGGELEAGAESFVTYWMGAEVWRAMPPERREGVIKVLPKLAAEWGLMFSEETGADTYARLSAPALLVLGARTTLAARRTVEVLHRTLRGSRVVEIPGAGHMAPLTHADAVNAAIEAHLDAQAEDPGPRQPA